MRIRDCRSAVDAAIASEIHRSAGVGHGRVYDLHRSAEKAVARHRNVLGDEAYEWASLGW